VGKLNFIVNLPVKGLPQGDQKDEISRPSVTTSAAGKGHACGVEPVLIANGPREAQRLLLAALRAEVARVRADPGLLQCPLRVVVSSRSLAQHLQAELVREVGHAVAGFRVQTLYAVALEVIAAAGERAPRGDALFGILVRRAARREPPLHAALDALEDGYAAATGAVADLLDAGFAWDVPTHAEALDEALAEAGLELGARRRARSLARVAAATGRSLAEHGLGRRADRIARAAQLLDGEPSWLACRGVWIHGFADATGVSSDLLEVLVRRLGARVLLDHPPDPARPERPDLGAAFTERLRQRLGGRDALGSSPSAAKPVEPPRISTIRAVGTDVEVRAVADRVHGLLEAGVEAESIAIVARDLTPYAVSLRTQLGRLGIPFSGFSSLGPPTGRRRRLHALLDLISQGQALTAERWLEAWAGLGRPHLADLRLGLHSLGAARLRDVAGLDVSGVLRPGDQLPLPARRGLAAASEGGDGDIGPRARRRQLSGQLLRRAVGSARAVCAHLDAWPEHAPLSRHLDEFVGLVRRELGWSRGPQRAELDSAIAGLRAELPELALGFDEVVALLRRVLGGAGAERLGGAGAGVRVLGVVEARGLCFEQLFLMGLNRDVFPRPLVDDPLFPDSVRRPLEPLLAEIPIKARGFEEEHYLFAQLLAASPEVTLSWQVADDEGRARSPSPFVERLRSAGLSLACEDAPSLQAPPQRSAGRPRTAAEAAVSEALHGSPARFRELLALVACERGELDVAAGVPVEPAALARGRAAVLAELAERPGRARLGPYLGFVGPMRLSQDLRRADPYVTHVEGIVRCPWEHFVKRLLGLEPPRDALDSLPESSPLLVGNLVHRVLERIVADAGLAVGSAIDAAAAAREVAWPEPEPLERLLSACAVELLAEEGMGPPGFARVLVEAARPLVAQARELAWPAGESPVRCLGAELTGEVELETPDGKRQIRFRADRVDRLEAPGAAAASGATLRLVDYKTGKGTDLTGRSPADRRRKLLATVASGANLQAAAYAFSAGGEGRYLFLARGSDPAAVFEAQADDPELRKAFEAAASTALGAAARGVFFPRLAGPDEAAAPKRCDWCDVREACLQGDAGARQRLFDWGQRAAPGSDLERAALELWRLPEAEAP